MRILIVDDHLVVREGMAQLLASTFPAVELFEATDARSALSTYSEGSFDLVILDIGLPGVDGFTLLQKLFALNDRVRVLMFSAHTEAGYVGRALRLGARGYISKAAPADELIAAVKAIAAGSRYVEAELATELAAVSEKAPSALTRREEEVLRLLAEGNSLQEIAKQARRTYKHISNTVISIKGKLGARNSADLLRMSILETQRRSEDA